MTTHTTELSTTGYESDDKKNNRLRKRVTRGVAALAASAAVLGVAGCAEGNGNVAATTSPSHETTQSGPATPGKTATPEKPTSVGEVYTGPSMAEMRAMSHEQFNKLPITARLHYASQYNDAIKDKITPANMPEYPNSVPNTHPSIGDSGQTYVDNVMATSQYLLYYMWKQVALDPATHNGETSTLVMQHDEQYKVLSSEFDLSGPNGSDNLRRVGNLFTFYADQDDRSSDSGLITALSTKTAEPVTIEGVKGELPAKVIHAKDNGGNTFDETIALVPYLAYNKANPNQGIPAKQWVSVGTVNQN